MYYPRIQSGRGLVVQHLTTLLASLQSAVVTLVALAGALIALEGLSRLTSTKIPSSKRLSALLSILRLVLLLLVLEGCFRLLLQAVLQTRQLWYVQWRYWTH